MDVQQTGPRSDPRGASHQPLVSIKTLGTFEVFVQQRPAVWKAGGSGSRQLKRAVALLIARRDQPVRKDVLIDVAGGYEGDSRRGLVSNVVRLLKAWGLEPALKIHELTIMLRRHESWQTDTDRIELIEAAACERAKAGDHQAAISLLTDAANLCRGEYLPNLDTIPEYVPQGQNAYWKTVQKRVLVSLLTACLNMAEPEYHLFALSKIEHLIDLDHYDPQSLHLAAAIARRCGNEEAARAFERRAQELAQEVGGV